MNFSTNVNILNLLSITDWTVFFLVIIATITCVVWGQIKKDTQTETENFLDLMLMGRQLTLPMFVATLVATWYGGIFGVAQIAFDNGIYNFVTQGLFWYFAYLIFAFFIVNKITPYKAMTLPDLVGKMFGPKSEKISAIFNVFNLVPIAYAISIGQLIQILFGISLTFSISLGVVFVIIYSLFGGMRAVVFSDLIQFFVMCFSVIIIALFSINTFGINYLFETLPKSYFNPMGTYSLSQTFVWGLIALSTLVDPNFYQRAFAAKSFKVAKKGIIVSTIIWIIFDLSLTMGAMYAKAVIPEAESTQAYLIYALQLLPNGLRGLILAGISATILSTLDSYIFLAGSTIAYDLVPKRFKSKILIHHLSIICVGLISIVLAISFEGDIKNVWKTLGSLSASALLIPILAGYIFKNRFSDNQFVFSSLSGAVVTIFWRLSSFKSDTGIDELYVGSLACLVVLLFSKRKGP